MKKFYTVLLSFMSIFVIGQDCNFPGEAQIDLNVNNISAGLLSAGSLWWDGASGQYITPSEGAEDVTAIFAGALWIGGYALIII